MSHEKSNTALILRELKTETGTVPVSQRPTDGYLHLNPMAKAAGKLVGHWLQNEDTKEYLEALSSAIGIPIAELVQKVVGGIPRNQGTWAHPEVALKFAAWCNKRFEVQVFRWTNELRTTGAVDLRQKPLHPRERHAIATQQYLQYLDDEVKTLDKKKADVIYVDFRDSEIERALRDEFMRKLTGLSDQMQYQVLQEEKRQQMRQKAAIARRMREGSSRLDFWLWEISGGFCMNTACHIRLNIDADQSFSNSAHIDEIIAQTRGGYRCIANTQLLCRTCNLRKKDRYIDYRSDQIKTQAMRDDEKGWHHHELIRLRHFPTAYTASLFEPA